MSPSRFSQRGEGKLGCLVTLLVVGTLTALLIKVAPVYYANMELVDKADFAGSMASRAPAEQVESEVLAKAREFDIPEALKPGAIKVTKSAAGDTGTCTIVLKYTRKVDLYGFTTLEIKQNKTIKKQIFTNL